MTIEDGKISGCTVTENGQCAFHGAEVERRKNSQRQIEDIETDITKHSGYIADLLTFMNNVKGQRTILYSVVGLFVTGAFAFTYISSQALTTDIRDLRVENDRLESRLRRAEADYARTDEKFKSVIAQISILNTHLSVLIKGRIDGKIIKNTP